MSFPVRFNWALHIEVPEGLQVGATYSFSKTGNRIFPIGTPIDLINMEREAIAKIKIVAFTNDGEKTTGSYAVIKLYESTEKEVLTRYWKENV